MLADQQSNMYHETTTQKRKDMVVTAAAPEITRIYGLPIQQAVITQGRGRGKPSTTETKCWGLRPKARVVFTLPDVDKEVEAIWFKGTVRLLPKNDDDECHEYSYQELKYSKIPAASSYWQDQFRLEQPKWQTPPLESWDDFVALRTFRPCSAPTIATANSTSSQPTTKKAKKAKTEQHFEFDYYPCSFWLQEGFTHSKM